MERVSCGLGPFFRRAQPLAGLAGTPGHVRERSVTSDDGGGAALQRRTNMSLTIMIEIMISTMVVTMLRKRGRAAWRTMGRDSGMMVRSRRVRNGRQRHSGAGATRFQRGGGGRRNHAPGAVERALAQLKAKQAVAFERAG